MNEEERRAEFENLKKAGISASPLAFPRDLNDLPEPFPLLGGGAQNKVYKTNWDGKFLAWKPIDACSTPNPTAVLAGIKDDQYFPVESHLLAVTIAKAIAGDNHQACVMGDATVVDINRKYGLLMDIASGQTRRIGGHQFFASVPSTDPLYSQCLRFKDQLSDPRICEAQCKILGVNAISWHNGSLRVTSSIAYKEEPFEEQLFSDPGFLEQMCTAQLVAHLAGWTDCHTGNIFIAGGDPVSDPGPVRVTMIDGDDCGAVKSWEEMMAIDADRHEMYFMTPPVKWISPAVADRIHSFDFDKRINALCFDLEGHYPQERIDAIKSRVLKLKQGVIGGTIQIIRTPSEWLKVDFSDPMASFVGRARGILKRRGLNPAPPPVLNKT
jgi:hypothetical protein